MIADGLLAILAGYDTTATVLAALFHYLLCNHHVYVRLQGEVDEYFKKTEGAPLDSSKLATLPYLSAVMLVNCDQCPLFVLIWRCRTAMRPFVLAALRTPFSARLLRRLELGLSAQCELVSSNHSIGRR